MNSIINFSLNVEASALDPVIINMTPDDFIEAVVYDVCNLLRFRLLSAGFDNYKQAIVASRPIIYYLESYLPQYTYVISEPIVSGDYVYVLTKFANGKRFIHPPYKDDDTMMTWEEYFSRLVMDDRLHLMVTAPWAQARIKLFTSPIPGDN